MATRKKRQCGRHGPQATNCRDCGLPFGPDRPRHLYTPGRCEVCGRRAAKLANRRSYERRNQHRLGKPRGPAPGTIHRPAKPPSDDLIERVEAARRERAMEVAAQGLPHTCEFCARYAYRHGTGSRFCELKSVGLACLWKAAYGTKEV